MKRTVYREIKGKINKKNAAICIMGLGYVGLPIALELCKKGYYVYGLDNNSARVKSLCKGMSYIDDIKASNIRKALDTQRFEATTDPEVISGCDVIIVCVPTPLSKTKEPDISYIVKASKILKERMRAGQLIIVESTTYPGTTREVILPELESTGLVLDEHFFLAFSPERIDPGNKKYTLTNIPKVIGGLTPKSTELGKLVYSTIIKKVVGVSSAEVAEVTKLLENTFRIINIGLMNEFAILCDKLNIDVWEVIESAKTKPFGFMPFYPGPGIGGHCIPADPIYLSWKANTVGFKTEMIDLAASVNEAMPAYVVTRMRRILSRQGLKLSNARVLIMGVTYKKDVDDLRESPAIEVIKKIRNKCRKIYYHDPYIPNLDWEGVKMKGSGLTSKVLNDTDIAVILTDHSSIDYDALAKKVSMIFDTRNVYGSKKSKYPNVVSL